MSDTIAANYQVRSDQRGGHWVAWLTDGTREAPVHCVLLVGETRDEAESRAREWIANVPAYVRRPFRPAGGPASA